MRGSHWGSGPTEEGALEEKRRYVAAYIQLAAADDSFARLGAAASELQATLIDQDQPPWWMRQQRDASATPDHLIEYIRNLNREEAAAGARSPIPRPPVPPPGRVSVAGSLDHQRIQQRRRRSRGRGVRSLHVRTDLGGLIRLPGTWLGLATLKPSNGLVALEAPTWAGPHGR